MVGRTHKIIVVVIIIALLLLGIGYAAIQNITLNISGTASADPKQSNFNVAFLDNPEVSDSTMVTASITDDCNANINVSGLTKKGQTATATYTIKNKSADLSSDLEVLITNSNEEYFTVSTELNKNSLTAEEITVLVVTVELAKTPILNSVSSTIGVQLNAMPVQPGNEGSSSEIIPTPTITLASVTNDNIGDYIDLKNNIVKTDSTNDDWRILYVDENTVYAILSDILPNDLNGVSYAQNAGLYTTDTYYVTSSSSADFISKTSNSDAWSGLANGISGAVVKGTPDREIMLKSYNTKNGTELSWDENNRPKFDLTTEDSDLYIINVLGVRGYWLATGHDVLLYDIFGVASSGDIGHVDCSFVYYAIRPIVELPKSTICRYLDGIWVVEQ